MLKLKGETHTLFWQFIPFKVILSKYGEAVNKSSLIVDPDANLKLDSIQWHLKDLQFCNLTCQEFHFHQIVSREKFSINLWDVFIFILMLKINPTSRTL